VAESLGRQWIGCELNPEYLPLQNKRIRQRGLVLPMLGESLPCEQ